MQLGFLLPWALLALAPVWGLIWWWYRRRRPAPRPVAGIWLWQQAKQKGQSRRRFDLRLFLLLLGATMAILAIASPKLELQLPGELVVVLDTSASMSATDVAPNRLERAKQVIRQQLERSPRAVLVTVGDKTQTYGPALGQSLVPLLGAIQAQSKSADLQVGVARGRQLLPGAKVLVVADAEPPAEADGYINVAGSGQNIGISAVAPGFLALANSGPGRWSGQVQVGGKNHSVNVPAGGYATLEVPDPDFEARLMGQDVLSLDDQASFGRRLVRVDFSGNAPALERLLSVLGTARGTPAELNFELGTPKTDPTGYTVYFATQANGSAQVLDVERTQELLRGVELVGYALPIPATPKGTRWRALASGENGKILAWYQEKGLYLPPVEALQNLPAFPVLLYNLIAPRSEIRKGLLRPAESLLPRPRADIPLPPALTVFLAPWLALLAASVLALEAWLFRRKYDVPSPDPIPQKSRPEP